MSRSRILQTALLAGAIVLSASMATARPVESKRPLAKVTGVLTFREDLEFLPGTIVRIAIRDAADAASSSMEPLARVVIREPKRAPIRFEILYDPAKVKLDHEYILHARVFTRRDGQYTSGPGMPVITMKNRTRDIRVPMNPIRPGPRVSY